MTKGTGKLDGKDIGAGLVISIKSGDILTISASALANVEIINHGLNTVRADCSLTAENVEDIESIKEILNQNSSSDRLKFLK